MFLQKLELSPAPPLPLPELPDPEPDPPDPLAAPPDAEPPPPEEPEPEAEPEELDGADPEAADPPEELPDELVGRLALEEVVPVVLVLVVFGVVVGSGAPVVLPLGTVRPVAGLVPVPVDPPPPQAASAPAVRINAMAPAARRAACPGAVTLRLSQWVRATDPSAGRSWGSR